MTELDEDICHLAWLPVAAFWAGCVVAGIAGAVIVDHLRRTP